MIILSFKSYFKLSASYPATLARRQETFPFAAGMFIVLLCMRSPQKLWKKLQPKLVRAIILSVSRWHKSISVSAELCSPDLRDLLAERKSSIQNNRRSEFSHCSMGKGRSHMQAGKHLSPPPARVYSEGEASSDTVIAMRGNRPPIPGYLPSNQFWYIIFI